MDADGYAHAGEGLFHAIAFFQRPEHRHIVPHPLDFLGTLGGQFGITNVAHIK